MPRKLPYAEGDQIAVPFASAWGLGVIARADRRGVALGYFFRPALTDLPVEPKPLRAADAAYIVKFGDLGLLQGDWVVLGRSPDFNRARWPVPAFGQEIDGAAGRGYRRTYDDALRPVAEEVLPLDKIAGLPRDGTAGYRYLELALARILGEEAGAEDAPYEPRRPLTIDSDDAQDWFANLAATSDLSALVLPLTVVLDARYVEITDAAVALAAAETVAAAIGSPGSGLPSQATAWVKRHQYAIDRETIAMARRAAERVSTDSELQELWHKSPRAGDWRADVRNLLMRLSGSRDIQRR